MPWPYWLLPAVPRWAPRLVWAQAWAGWRAARSGQCFFRARALIAGRRPQARRPHRHLFGLWRTDRHRLRHAAPGGQHDLVVGDHRAAQRGAQPGRRQGRCQREPDRGELCLYRVLRHRLRRGPGRGRAAALGRRQAHLRQDRGQPDGGEAGPALSLASRRRDAAAGSADRGACRRGAGAGASRAGVYRRRGPAARRLRQPHPQHHRRADLQEHRRAALAPGRSDQPGRGRLLPRRARPAGLPSTGGAGPPTSCAATAIRRWPASAASICAPCARTGSDG